MAYLLTKREVKRRVKDKQGVECYGIFECPFLLPIDDYYRPKSYESILDDAEAMRHMWFSPDYEPLPQPSEPIRLEPIPPSRPRTKSEYLTEDWKPKDFVIPTYDSRDYEDDF